MRHAMAINPKQCVHCKTMYEHIFKHVLNNTVVYFKTIESILQV